MALVVASFRAWRLGGLSNTEILVMGLKGVTRSGHGMAIVLEPPLHLHDGFDLLIGYFAAPPMPPVTYFSHTSDH